MPSIRSTSPQKLKLKSTPVKQVKVAMEKNAPSETVIHENRGRASGYFTINPTQKTAKTSIKILNGICLEVIYGKSKLLKTKKSGTSAI